MFGDALGLSLIFAASACGAALYYRAIPSEKNLRQRLPNQPSAAGVLGFLLIGGLAWYLIRSNHGFIRVSVILAILFDLLIFETAVLLFFRWIRSNLLSVIAALGVAALAWYLQQTVHSNTIYSFTFIIATFGATALLTRLKYLRGGFLILIASLWTIYDVVSSTLVYPVIYRPAVKPVISFFYPAVAVGQITLGAGDFMFMTLFTLVLYRDCGWRYARLHIILQTIVLLIVAALRPANVGIPYLLVMTPLFLGVQWWAKKDKQPSAG